MRRSLAGILLVSTLLLAGCGGGNGVGKVMEITENGTYDVSGYDQVVVAVGDEVQDAVEGHAESAANDAGLNLVRAKLKYFSMEVPELMVKDYTEQELTEDDMHTFMFEIDNNVDCMLSITAMKTGGTSPLETFSDGPQEEVNGIVMAIKHEHAGDQRKVRVDFIEDGVLHTITLYYPVARYDVYGDYAEQFYRTIQMN